MKAQNDNFKSMLENLTEEEKMQMFSIEELENRLEMAALSTASGEAATNSHCGSNNSWC
jgi:hypothetical protein